MPNSKNVGTLSTGQITPSQTQGAVACTTAARVDCKVAGAISRHCASSVVAWNGCPAEMGALRSVTRAMTATNRKTAARKRKTAKDCGSDRLYETTRGSYCA